MHSREQSPTFSHHSKFSNSSSIASDHSRQSHNKNKSVKNERTFQQLNLSYDKNSHSQSNFYSSNSNKALDILNIDDGINSDGINCCKIDVPTCDEMSPISASSSLPEIGEIDCLSPKKDCTSELILEPVDNVNDEKCMKLNENNIKKNDDRSSDTFSDWSDADDDLLLKNDELEMLDEATNLSESILGKSMFALVEIFDINLLMSFSFFRWFNQ